MIRFLKAHKHSFLLQKKKQKFSQNVPSEVRHVQGTGEAENIWPMGCSAKPREAVLHVTQSHVPASHAPGAQHRNVISELTIHLKVSALLYLKEDPDHETVAAIICVLFFNW